jgi:hypothetical protein
MEDNPKNMIEDKPPFLGSWNKIYLIVFGELIILIALFYLFTQAFS